jgi:hypothetical protein
MDGIEFQAERLTFQPANSLRFFHFQPIPAILNLTAAISPSLAADGIIVCIGSTHEGSMNAD